VSVETVLVTLLNKQITKKNSVLIYFYIQLFFMKPLKISKNSPIRLL